MLNKYLRLLIVGLHGLALLGSQQVAGQDASAPPNDAAQVVQEAAPARAPKSSPGPASGVQDAAAKARDEGWKSLIPEKGLDGWEITDFGGQGEVKRQGDEIILEVGDPLTGITYKKGDFPKDNYEIEVEAQRIEGSDFLCGLTFPVGDEFCSLIAGGWGGGVVGLSSVDGYDASENATSLYHPFDNGKWYKFRVRVTPASVVAWINDKEVIEQEREGHEFTTRIEVYVSQPLGYSAFGSKVGVRNFRWRPVKGDKP